MTALSSKSPLYCKAITQICHREWEVLGQVHPSCGWDGFSRTWQAAFAFVHPLGDLEQGSPGFVPSLCAMDVEHFGEITML